jgi:hypothetical protein
MKRTLKNNNNHTSIQSLNIDIFFYMFIYKKIKKKINFLFFPLIIGNDLCTMVGAKKQLTKLMYTMTRRQLM